MNKVSKIFLVAIGTIVSFVIILTLLFFVHLIFSGNKLKNFCSEIDINLYDRKTLIMRVDKNAFLNIDSNDSGTLRIKSSKVPLDFMACVIKFKENSDRIKEYNFIDD